MKLPANFAKVAPSPTLLDELIFPRYSSKYRIAINTVFLGIPPSSITH